nr:non-heme iron oxygenase ferredoxin subunit [Lentzea sp. NBRC 105346]
MPLTRVCAVSDLDDSKPFLAEVDDTAVVLVRVGERVHALADECSHAAISLSEGEVSRKGIECYLHGSCFDLETGKPSSFPATEPVDVYAVDIRDGDVFVDVTVTTN